MPGFICHLACANTVWKERKDLDYTKFVLGNITPDLAKDKQKSHFRVPNGNGWYIPNILEVEKTLLKPDSSFLGMYCHLFLDYFFISNYLSRRYRFHPESNIVENLETGEIWDGNVFLSPKGLYGSYSDTNQALLDDGFLPDEVFKLPDSIPKTNLSIFDDRNDSNWLEDTKKYLLPPKEDCIKVFSLEEYEDLITRGANLFLDKISGLETLD
ncbi:zinc dependent phospholipase C family protein [Candidatus Saccharibacteria bacterium]|nr:zinc dependent phospholipase C family protein [Candidatus Saccharibacteria bacterium]